MKNKEVYNYFDKFINTSEYIVKSAKMLKEFLNNYNHQRLENNVKEIHDLENLADKNLHDIKNYLIVDFLPPIDREDISLIGNELDNIEDYIDELIINFDILNIDIVNDEAKEFAELLEKCTSLVKEAMNGFKDFKKKEQLKEYIIKINEIEEQGDRLFENSMRRLYKEIQDPIEVIKWTTIYNCFENTIDSCEHLADCVEDVVMKNS